MSSNRRQEGLLLHQKSYIPSLMHAQTKKHSQSGRQSAYNNGGLHSTSTKTIVVAAVHTLPWKGCRKREKTVRRG